MKVQFPVVLVVNVLSFYTLHMLWSHWVCITCVHVLLPGCMSSFHPADQRKCHYGKWCQSKGPLPFPKADWPAQSCLLKEDNLYYIHLADVFYRKKLLMLRSTEIQCLCTTNISLKRVSCDQISRWKVSYDNIHQSLCKYATVLIKCKNIKLKCKKFSVILVSHMLIKCKKLKCEKKS